MKASPTFLTCSEILLITLQRRWRKRMSYCRDDRFGPNHLRTGIWLAFWICPCPAQHSGKSSTNSPSSSVVSSLMPIRTRDSMVRLWESVVCHQTAPIIIIIIPIFAICHLQFRTSQFRRIWWCGSDLFDFLLPQNTRQLRLGIFVARMYVRMIIIRGIVLISYYKSVFSVLLVCGQALNAVGCSSCGVLSARTGHWNRVVSAI